MREHGHTRERRAADRRTVLVAVLGMALLTYGCAGTRVGQLGVLPDRESLVTLVVSEDRRVVGRECGAETHVLPVLGCQTSHVVSLPAGGLVRAVRVVRYTDALPSEAAFEIDVHELCHVVAALQRIDDPCHIGNSGVLHSAVDTGLAISRR